VGEPVLGEIGPKQHLLNDNDSHAKSSLYFWAYKPYKDHRVGRLLSFFSSRRNWDSPNPSPSGECAPPPSPFGSGGMGSGHARRRERGWESSNSDEGTYTVVTLHTLRLIEPKDGQSGADVLLCTF
jgi:hypothetical protein